MGPFEVLQLVGGIALFLYGMEIMGDGLKKLGGGKLEHLLERLTSNPIKGVCLGALVTAVIQSSAATTVMVVGFVNSGIMKLSQSIGIIMGANIGTTITSWILSLSAVDGESFFIQILKPVNFTPVFALAGILMIMLTKKNKYKNIANICLGFAILMFGMNTMSTAVQGLKDSESFMNILVMFKNPILGVIAGALLTAVLQSSSASIGILQALSATGKVNFGAALPLIMGQNIGSCVTCLISCIGTSKNAKRTAMVHLYFNIIGTILFLVLFYAVNAFVHFSFIDSSVNAFNIAVVHTVFNVLATAVLLPFNKLLEKLAKMTIKDGASTDVFSVLDDRFFQNPQFGIDQCTSLTTNMAYIARETFDLAVQSMTSLTDKTETLIIDNENQLDEYEDALSKYLVRISAKATGNHQSRQVTMLLHAISEFERITDYEASVLYTSRAKAEKSLQFSEKANVEMNVMVSAVRELMDKTIEVFINNDAAEALSIEPLVDVIDMLSEELKKRHIARMREGKCTVETGILFTDYVTAYEKISHHCKNTAAFVIQRNDTGYQMHSEAHEARRASLSYKQTYECFRKKYALPFSNSTAGAADNEE